ncbi:MAG: putative transport system permease protein [Acidimicrobiaceae bacterium]|jgi:putative ABC transport system permease protein
MILFVALGVIGACVVVGILSVTIFDLYRRPTFRRLAFRNALRRKNEALLVVLGSLFGTAIVTSAFAVGDTLNASIRDEARTRLGPIDEIVLVHRSPVLPEVIAKITAKPLPNTDGLLSMVTAPVTAASVPAPGRERFAEPEAFVHEIDFEAARAMGGRVGDTGLAAAGPTPSGAEAVIGQDLADQLHLQPGDPLQVFVFNQTLVLGVRGVVPRLGVAGFHPGFGAHAENVFLAPGTLDVLAAKAPRGAVAPEGRVLVSNVGGVFSGVVHSETVARDLQIRTAGIPGVEVSREKRGELDFADRQGSSFTQLFGLIGGFTVVAGVLLLINIFVMLAEERKSELGMLRALGLKRNHLVRAFGLEGTMYALTAAVVGAGAGIGVGRVVVSVTEGIFSQGDRGTTLQFSVRPTSVLIGFSIGLVISLLTVWGTSIRIGRLNVIRAIRDLPEPVGVGHPWRALVVAGLGLAAGSQLLIAGVSGESPVLALVGPAIALWSVVPYAARFFSRRWAVTVPCAALLVYVVGAFTLLPSTFAKPGIEVFFAQGIILVFTAVGVAIANGDEFHRVSDRLSATGRGLATRLGLANPLAKRFRTALLLGMYALIMFVLVFMSVFAAVFEAQGPQVADDTRAGYDLVVDSNPSNPVSAEQLQSEPDIAATAPMVWALAKFETATEADSFQRRFSGFDESLLANGVPALSSRDKQYISDEAAWRAVLASPDLVIVPSDFLSVGEGPPSSTVKVGQRITLVDPAGGGRHDLTVAAIDGDLDPADNGAMVAARTVPTLVDRSFAGRFYVAVREGADPAQVGVRLKGDLLANGVKADTFRALVDDRLRGTTAFIRLLEGFLALGLVIGIAGLGVVMVRAVRERRREIGMLRAMGFPARVVRRAFLIEATFIAAQGIVIGGALGLVTGFSVLSNSSTFGDKTLPFTVPWGVIGLLALAALVASLLAVAAPATQAARIKPAVALRIAD